MTKCRAWGAGWGTGRGKTKREAKFRAGMEAYARAVATAELDAAGDCPRGCRCKGEITRVYPPAYIPMGKQGGEYVCEAYVVAIYRGKCKCKPGAAPPQGVREIESRTMRAFRAEVKRLPKKPRRVSGPCRMYREKTHGHWEPVCAGDCERGRCRLTAHFEPGRFSARCNCD